MVTKILAASFFSLSGFFGTFALAAFVQVPFVGCVALGCMAAGATFARVLTTDD